MRANGSAELLTLLIGGWAIKTFLVRIVRSEIARWAR